METKLDNSCSVDSEDDEIIYKTNPNHNDNINPVPKQKMVYSQKAIFRWRILLVMSAHNLTATILPSSKSPVLDQFEYARENL